MVEGCEDGNELSGSIRGGEFFTGWANIGLSMMIIFLGIRCEGRKIVCARKRV